MDKDWISPYIDVAHLQGQIVQLYKTRHSLTEQIIEKEKELEEQRKQIKKINNV